MKRTYAVIGLIWFICVAPDITDLFVTLATEPISFFQHNSVFCLRESVFKDPILAQKRKAFDIIYFSCVFLTLVFTYLKILFAARALSRADTSAQKARNTILLHGVQLAMCLLSYISPSVEIVLHVIFPGRILEIRFANYLIVYILPRFLSPIIYGARDKKFKKYLRMDVLRCSCKYKGKPVVPLNKDRMWKYFFDNSINRCLHYGLLIMLAKNNTFIQLKIINIYNLSFEKLQLILPLL